MKKWTRRAFVSTGVLAGGAAIFGVAIRPGNRAGKMEGKLAKENESLVNLWIKVAADNTITAYIPHAEMGQGVHTSLAMMLADELDADWDNLKIEEAPAHKEYASGGVIRGFGFGDSEYSRLMQDTMNGLFNTIAKVMNMQLTGGSASVRFTGKYVMRIAGAAAKEMIKKAAAKAWNVPFEELTTEKSHVLHVSSGKKEPYATFAVAATEEKMAVQPKLKEPNDFKIMGTSPQRNDIPAKVNGTAQFGLDVALPDMKYATIKAAPVFGAKVVSVDTTKLKETDKFQKVVQLETAVALVGESYWEVKQGLNNLNIEFSSTGSESLNTEAVFEKQREFLLQRDKWEKAHTEGNVDAVFEASETLIERTYKVPYLAHAAMEPLNCTIWLQKDKCEVWIGCQNPLGIKKAVAQIVDLDKDQVLVYNQYLGGGFGRKSETDVAEQAAHIAKEILFPVKLIWSREEDVQQDKYREGSISSFKVSMASDGVLSAWQNAYTYQNHPNEASIPPYAIPNVYVGYVTPESHIPWGNWRSVSHSKHGFFVESFIDEVAIEAGKSPLTYRIELLSQKPRLQKVLQVAAEKAGWGTSLPKGEGLGLSVVESFGTMVAQVAKVKVKPDGSLKVQKVFCVADPGFAMHKDGFVAQMESGIIFGLAAALYGEINIENGAVKESNFHDYEMLRMYDAPDIETHIINSGETIGGAGEPSTPGIAPAVCNAIFAATGIRVRELPIRNSDLSQKKWSV